MSRVDDAVMRLYERADLRDELTDEEADRLLKWASGEIARLDQSAADETFEARVAALMKLLKDVNRFAGRQGQLSAQADDPLPAAIAANATEFGRSLSPAQIAAAATGDPEGTISSLTTLISASAGQSSSPSFSFPSITPPVPDSTVPPAAESGALSPNLSSGDDPFADEA